MHHPATILAAGAAVLAALPGAQAGLYAKNSPVLQVDGKSYDRLIAKSNHTSIVEFYAPWCGHCQNLKPAFEKAAKNLDGLAKVAAVDCDDESNKAFCGGMGIKGFPTLKIVRPGKKPGRPVVEDYQGPRTATGIVDAVVSKINNHVTKVTDKDIDSFLSNKNETAKALLFTDKGTTSALLRSLAIDFLDVVSVAQVRNKESKTVELFGISKFPTFVLLPGGDQDGVVYDGELKKDAMVKFLSQAAPPNPDPAPPAGKKEKKEKKEKKKEKAEEKSSASPSSETSADSTASTEEASTAPAAEQPTAPVIVETATPIPALNTPEKLQKECLTSKSNTCVLALVPDKSNEVADKALASLAELSFKHAKGKRHLFPFFSISSDNSGAASLTESLKLSGEVEVIAVNAKRGWWRRYEGDFSLHSVESWIDAIRMSEGTKEKLPAALVVEGMAIKEEATSSTPAPEAETQPPVEEPSAAASDHDEL